MLEIHGFMMNIDDVTEIVTDGEITEEKIKNYFGNKEGLYINIVKITVPTSNIIYKIVLRSLNKDILINLLKEYKMNFEIMTEEQIKKKITNYLI